MKCPKCSYVSFDYNLSCPKCGKDISAEQSKLNILAFRPEAPFLLGGLLGHSDENNTALSAAGSSPMGFVGESRQGRIDSPESERGEITFEESGNFDLSADEDGSPQDTADFELGREANPVELKESPIEDLALESDTLAIEQIDEDDLIPAAGELRATAESEEVDEIDLDALDLDSKVEESGEGKDEIQLSLDDLKVNDSGELEIGKAAGGDIDKSLEIDELTLDEIPLGDELSLEESGEKADAAKAEMGEEGETINLDDLELDLDLEEEEKRPRP
jgi:hypothetical protein